MEKVIRKEGNGLWRFCNRFNFAADKFIAEVIVFAIVLTLVIYIWGLLIGNGPMKLLDDWYAGFFSNIMFTFQLSFLIVVCATCAKAPQVRKLLIKLSYVPKTRTQAILLIMLFGYATGLINWGFCNIVTPILAMYICRAVKGIHWPMIVAASFAAQTWTQCMAPAASVYALLNTEGHFMEETLGIMNASVTAFNPANIFVWVIGVVVTIIVVIATKPGTNDLVELQHIPLEEDTFEEIPREEMTVADKMNTMRILTYAIGIACMIMVVKDIATKGFLNSINLNYMIFLFFGLNCLLYKTPKRMMDAYKPNMVLCCEIATIYFLYSSLASLMAGSGISEIITTWTIAHSDAQTLPVFVYWCASFINLFVPSQGGQWIIQGPIVIEAAQQLGAHVPTVINAFVYGDQGTNMLQPLYAIPLLSVAGMKLKDCWGMMAFIWIFWLILTSLGLYFGPLLLN